MSGGDTTARPARLGPADLLRAAVAGLRARPTRGVLSALGVAIGIAAMLAVVGVSESSTAELNHRLDALGTNLLRVGPGENVLGERAVLPDGAAARIERIGPVESVAAVGRVDAHVYRSDRIPAGRSGSISVLAAKPRLAEELGAELAAGGWLNEATARYPAVVLGARAAERLGVGSHGVGQRVWLGAEWFTVVGVLQPVTLAAELDTAALVGWSAAETHLDFSGQTSVIYTRVAPDAVEDVRGVAGRTANPASPNEVEVSRPSQALEARREVDAAMSAMLLGLGGVSLLVGGIGVANTMVVSVLERRGEIGLRRALGATHGAVRAQFLTESLLLSFLGGAAGTGLGAAVTVGYATVQGWPSVVPLWSVGAGLAAALTIGALAGLYPAVRASRLPPTEALAAR